MSGRICIVTGANAGIGKQASLQLAKAGFHVIMACRSRNRGEEARNEISSTAPSLSVELMVVDMGQLRSVRKLAEEFTSKYERPDVLIPQRSESSGTITMVPLPSECREREVRYIAPWGGKGSKASWVQVLPWGIDTFHS